MLTRGGDCGDGRVGALFLVFGEGRDDASTNCVATFADISLDVDYFSDEKWTSWLDVKLCLSVF